MVLESLSVWNFKAITPSLSYKVTFIREIENEEKVVYKTNSKLHNPSSLGSKMVLVFDGNEYSIEKSKFLEYFEYDKETTNSFKVNGRFLIKQENLILNVISLDKLILANITYESDFIELRIIQESVSFVTDDSKVFNKNIVYSYTYLEFRNLFENLETIESSLIIYNEDTKEYEYGEIGFENQIDDIMIKNIDKLKILNTFNIGDILLIEDKITKRHLNIEIIDTIKTLDETFLVFKEIDNILFSKCKCKISLKDFKRNYQEI